MLESNGRAFVLILVLAKAFIRNFLMLCYTVHITNDVCYLYFNYYFMKMISESILDGYNRSIVGCFVVENRTGFHDAIAGYQWILGIFHKWRPGCRSIYRGWRFRLYLESGRSRPRPPGWKNSSRRQISSGRLFLPIFVCFWLQTTLFLRVRMHSGWFFNWREEEFINRGVSVHITHWNGIT